MPKVGDEAKPPEVRARWAYSELASPRFATTYTVSQKLIDQANAGTEFEDLSAGDRTAMESAASTERAGLWPHLNRFSAFGCQSWTKAKVCRCLVLPALDPRRQNRIVPLLSFLAAPRFPELTDPRNAADAVPLGTPFLQKEAICVLPQQERFLIGPLARWMQHFSSQSGT